MMRVVLFLLCFLPGQALMAGTVTVLSGEHASFTRLTFSMPEGATYDVTSVDGSIRIAFSGPDPLRVDSARIFNRIRRDRISEVKAIPPAAIEIELGCNCTYSEFFQEPNLLVIDVREALDTETPEIESEPVVETPVPDLILPLRDGFTTEGTKDIAQAISRNITRGLLEQSTLRPGTGPVSSGQGFSGADFPAANVSLPAGTGDAEDEPDVKSCFAIAVAPLPAGLEGETYHARSGALTARLFRESGTVNAAVALDLARVQLAFGLATEALATLRFAESAAEDVAYFKEFASVIAERGPMPRKRLHAYRTCSALALLAATLSDDVNQIAQDDVPQLLIALEEASRPLLKIVGPKLTAALVASGLPDAAEQSLRIRQRALPEDPLRLADLEVAPETRAKDDVVREIAGSNKAEAVDAVVSLVTTITQSKQALNAEDATLVSSLAFENRKTGAAETIAKAEIYALASRGQFDEAFASFDRTEMSAPVRKEALAYLLSELARTGSDLTFLKHTIKRLDGIDGLSGVPAVEAVAQRLYETGFGTLADGLLARLARPSDDVLKGMIRHAAARGTLTNVSPELVGRARETGDPSTVYRLALLQSDFDRAAELAPPDSAGQSLRMMRGLDEAQDPASAAPETPEASLQASLTLVESVRDMTSRIEAALDLDQQLTRSDN
ncbi:hypothetical protein PGB28_17550 [Primorskyibacter aestuariivivens]|uniref:hypothetical protein n=1 Tax=Primorskyibacter aestuariivivens TaxID=1888912 RepID=UPI0023001265|nr:hypothetical protein [Primorskyibacter aestuariivivens]MDA7430272.1 hypothetical protein [Primorskyibacter aestuariivivens]